MRIATWNVNSIRARSESVVAWLVDNDIDAVALQETKCTDDGFPLMSFLAGGYDVYSHGDGGYNGVAIASRVGIDDPSAGFPDEPGYPASSGRPVVEARAVSAVCGGVRLWSVYVPNGRSPEDPHYRYKLDWLSAFADVAALWLAHDPAAQIALAGDWNVAPLDSDVWDPAYFDGRTHLTDAERAAFARFLDLGYQDAARPYLPEDAYTFWDYTGGRLRRDEGMRIDFALCSPALSDRVHHAWVDRSAREADGASDHAPVVFELLDV